MAVNYNPRVITDGLVLNLDAANKKSYNTVHNILPYSENATIDLYGLWVKANVTVPGTLTTAPDGTNTAYLIVPTAVDTFHYIAHIDNSVVAGKTYTHSVYAKAGGYSFIRLNFATDFTGNPGASFNLATGEMLSINNCTASISSVGNGWYRCSITATATFTGPGYLYDFPMPTNTTFFTGNGTSGVYMWGAQLENSSSPGEYLKTTGSRIFPSTTWTDLSGTSTNGTLTNGPTYNNSNNGSINFDGTNDYTLLTDPASLRNQNFSVSLWLKPGVQNVPIVTLMDFDHGIFQGWLIQSEDATTNRNFYFGYYSASGSGNGKGDGGAGKGIQLATGVWQNLVYIKNGNTLVGYLNGVLARTVTTNDSNVFYQSGRNFTIGRWVSGGFEGPRYFKGDIAHVQVYNRGLSAAEVTQNYNALLGRFGTQIVVDSSLKLWLDAGNSASYSGLGSTWTDISGTGNSGAIQSGVTYNASGWFDFNGTSGYVSLANQPTGFAYGAAPGTICAWAKTNSISGGFTSIFAYGTASIAQSRFIIINNAEWIAGGFGLTTIDITASGVPLNTWVHVTQVYDGTTAYFYINGVLAVSAARSWNTTVGIASVGRQTNSREHWNGSIAEVQVYNRALNNNEINQNYNATRKRYNR
jgi:hypothetical protein